MLDPRNIGIPDLRHWWRDGSMDLNEISLELTLLFTVRPAFAMISGKPNSPMATATKGSPS
ncbi:hypothetical protein [Pseudosulfitobacter pseudonitzschiae]|uniref:hypothetical protein n=1 Tax=Pseudosulfitobacter pseudonitzschiae TaxID=1402135 RepID=UPI001CD7C607|nr:hypothetical protein [Pseudosulfitobacter pseudonitzschiae]